MTDYADLIARLRKCEENKVAQGETATIYSAAADALEESAHSRDFNHAAAITALNQRDHLMTILRAALKDLETFEREVRTLAPEALAPSLPRIREALAKARS